MDAELSNFIAEVTALIRNGQGQAARRALRQLKHVETPREVAADVASLARRANLPGLAIRLLNPIVRPEDRAQRPATEREKAEYAASLTRVGASEEAIQILELLDGKTLPEVFLFRSLALMSRWEYAASVPLLREYLRTESLERYQRLIGMVNLTAALVYERNHDEATPLIGQLLESTSTGRWPLIEGYSLELAAQNAVLLGHWGEAKKYLDRSERALSTSVGIEALFVRKWRAILELSRSGPDARTLAALRLVEREARARQHWETLRDLDRWEAIFLQDEARLQRLYFGTSYESYRKKLLAEYPGQPCLPDEYRWRLGGGSRAQTAWTCDLLEAELVSPRGTSRFKPGKLLHRLLASLASDFYRPFRITSLHFLLYPDEFFNPVTSPARVHQPIHRLRAWLLESGVPLEIEEKDGFFRLGARSPVNVRLGNSQGIQDRDGFLLRRLRQLESDREFSAREASRHLGLTLRSTQRVLRRGEEKSELHRNAQGRLTRYRFVK